MTLERIRRLQAVVCSVPVFLLVILLVPDKLPAFFIDNRQSPSSQHWDYGGQNEWALNYKQCGKNAQSPIDIERRYVIPSNLKLHFYNYDQTTKFKLSNAHHTLKLNPIESTYERLKLPLNGEDEFNSSAFDSMTVNAGSDSEDATGTVQEQRSKDSTRIRINQTSRRIVPNGQFGRPVDNSIDNPNDLPYNGAPTIKLDWLDDGNNEYKLHDIHFHWGERRDNGSEHAIDGRRSAMEMHLVHIKNGFDKSKISFNSDSVTVIAILIESYRKSNADFNLIVNALNRINMTSRPQEIEYKSINDLLPSSLESFYHYSGSLTTPPCYQVVNWIVMSDRLYLNAKQIEMFRNLYAPPEHHGASGEPSLIMPNIRHIQPHNERMILSSFSPLSRLEQMANPQYSGAATSLNGSKGIQCLCSVLVTGLLTIWISKH